MAMAETNSSRALCGQANVLRLAPLFPGVTASFGPSLGRESASERGDIKPHISRRETQAQEQRIGTVSSGA